MSFDLNILVNGNRCKQYQHQGKTFIEAKNGSEYVLEIKNSYWKRILAVSSVDGLNVLTGKTATESDSGYIVPAYSTEKIKGFRFSDDEWALFKFGYKFNGNTYAQSKGNDAERNCGVIGFRLFYEQEPVVQWTYTTYPTAIPQWQPGYWTTTTGGISGTFNGGTNISYGCNSIGSQDQGQVCNFMAQVDNSSQKYDATLKSSTKSSSPLRSAKMSRKSSAGGCSASPITLASAAPAEFDMGTEWGRREASKVHTVQFDKGCLARSFEIYYASRDQLIKMGVPIHNVLNVPQAFPSAYAEPPRGWNG